VNTISARFDTITGQMTEMSQRKKTGLEVNLERKDFQFHRTKEISLQCNDLKIPDV